MAACTETKRTIYPDVKDLVKYLLNTNELHERAMVEQVAENLFKAIKDQSDGYIFNNLWLKHSIVILKSDETNDKLRLIVRQNKNRLGDNKKGYHKTVYFGYNLLNKKEKFALYSFLIKNNEGLKDETIKKEIEILKEIKNKGHAFAPKIELISEPHESKKNRQKVLVISEQFEHTFNEYIYGFKKGGLLIDNLKTAKQLMLCISKMHEHGIIHRDIKSNNLVLNKPEAGKNEFKDLRFIDIGSLGKWNENIPPELAKILNELKGISKTNESIFKIFFEEYDKAYQKPQDIWMAGHLLFILFENKLSDKFKEEYYKIYPQNIKDPIKRREIFFENSAKLQGDFLPKPNKPGSLRETTLKENYKDYELGYIFENILYNIFKYEPKNRWNAERIIFEYIKYFSVTSQAELDIDGNPIVDTDNDF